MTIDLTPFDTDAVPDRPAGADRIVVLTVFDRPDPEGTDPDVSVAMESASAEFQAAMVSALGDGDCHTQVIVIDNETTSYGPFVHLNP